ncbi:hypothetical protein MKK63_09345 [Methylobacterium sp. J-088]|uniref:hypothetical protein n=1 Tax=unclassified Methylobacterium TaxID=2615210 RepID=UPI001FB949FC|nr:MULTISPECIES: hypothetical protein [unclassified Methylobacterium]MCJ2062913.1 hypothetical protein [Methylobacterium sp. J-088]
METAIVSGAMRRTARAKRLRIRTSPPGLWLVGGGPASDDAPLAAADLIAMARAARGTSTDGTAGEPGESARGGPR